MDDAPIKPRLNLDRRKVVLGLGLAAASGFAQARQPAPNRPRIKTDEFKSWIPNKIGEYQFETSSGLVLPPSDALSDRLYDNLITRTYQAPTGNVVMLLIAYNNRQDGVLQMHRPEICYPAGGYTLSTIDPIDVAMPNGEQLPSQIFTARSDTRNEVVLYWTRVEGDFPRRWIEQRMAVAKANLRGIIPDGVLVRVSMLSGDLDHAEKPLEDFVRQHFRESPPHLRNLLFNTPLKA